MLQDSETYTKTFAETTHSDSYLHPTSTETDVARNAKYNDLENP